MDQRKKICRKCNERKPLEDFYFGRGEFWREKDCKLCLGKKVKESVARKKAQAGAQ